jgi:hypothetical protein
VEAVEEMRDIHVDDVAIRQPLRPRDTVADDLVDGRAHALRKTEIVERCGARTCAQGVGMDEIVDLVRGDSGANDATHGVQRCGGHSANLPHVLDFSGGLHVHVTVSKEHVVLSVPFSARLVEKECAPGLPQMRGTFRLDRLHCPRRRVS